jgi:hypothetical protein
MSAIFLASIAFVSADPTQPHLSQAWVAQSTGDGMQGAVGNEAYLFGEKEAHHLWDYGAECVKLVTCPDSTQICTAYYQNCDAVKCCKCDVDEPKQWDIQGAPDGFFNKVTFVGYEDTTELNGNPIQGAEHWVQHSGIPKVVNVEYDYFVHRENNSDVISHRIDFGAPAQNVSGSILYGGFAVQHDLDLHRQRFAVPDVCKGNILDCGCDDDGAPEIDAKWFRHAHAMRQVKMANSVQV